jgi:arylsulfatase A-like enzyme
LVAPGLGIVITAAIVVGVASGLLELVVRVAQVQVLHRVAWTSLMISRHAAWMLPLVSALVIVPMTVVLVWPVLAWASWRRRRRGAAQVVSWAWGWAGMVLCALFFFGPLRAIQGLHPAAPVALAVGLGFRLRRLFVGPTPDWRRGSGWGAVAILLLPPCALWHSGAVGRPSTFDWSPAPPASPNLLWIVVDTLRADRMSLYGYGRPTTPELESWAQAGITFDMARSAAPWTLPSHVTMFTGLWPHQHGASIDCPYFGTAPTLAEHLRAHGYQTAGIVANVRMCNAAYGLDRGFDHHVDYPCNREISLRAMMYNSVQGSVAMELGRRLLLPLPQPFPFVAYRGARAITGEARSWLDGQDRGSGSGVPATAARRPYFLFLNLMDVHAPYVPPADARRRFWTGPNPPRKLAIPGCGWDTLRARNAASPEQRPQRERELEATRRRLGDLYDDCLLALDAELGRFLRELCAAGHLTNTWVVITADHGEHFGEHDCFGHGSSLYNEQTHVPLILIPPLGAGVSGDDPAAALRGRRISRPVSLRDLPRTVTELLLPVADNPFPGRSLARDWNSAGSEPIDPIFAQLEEPRLAGDDFSSEPVTGMNSVIVDDYILIESSDRPPELYHLFADRLQQRNLAALPAFQPGLEMMRCTLSALRGRPGTL